MADLTYIQQKAFEKAARDDAGSMASAMPLPGPAASAFLYGPIQVGKWSVRKMVMSDWKVLQKINSGVMLNAAELDKPKEIRVENWTEQTDNELIWILTHTPDEIREALRAGFEAFCRRCTAETEDSIVVPSEYFALQKAVMEQINGANATILSHEDASKKEGGETHFFPVAERPAMDSAGTLNSSAA